jgi:hypothetical protein
MAISKTLTSELKRLAADSAAVDALPTTDEGARLLDLPAAEGQPAARLELFDLDRFSVSLRRLTLAAGALPPIDRALPDAAARRNAQLSALADAVIARLSYLEEPLALVEADAGEGQAQLRSSPPLREDGTISYWEVAISAGADTALSLARYHWSPEMPERESLPYPAASPQLGRLADSLAAALASILAAR